MISRVSSEDWARCYEAARKRRRAGPRDPLDLLLKRDAVREKICLIGSSVFIVALFGVFYSLLASRAITCGTETSRQP
jgi:hypothetical protein